MLSLAKKKKKTAKKFAIAIFAFAISIAVWIVYGLSVNFNPYDEDAQKIRSFIAVIFLFSVAAGFLAAKFFKEYCRVLKQIKIRRTCQKNKLAEMYKEAQS